MVSACQTPIYRSFVAHGRPCLWRLIPKHGGKVHLSQASQGTGACASVLRLARGLLRETSSEWERWRLAVSTIRKGSEEQWGPCPFQPQWWGRADGIARKKAGETRRKGQQTENLSRTVGVYRKLCSQSPREKAGQTNWGKWEAAKGKQYGEHGFCPSKKSPMKTSMVRTFTVVLKVESL